MYDKLNSGITKGIHDFDEELKASRQMTSTLKGREFKPLLPKEKPISNLATDKRIETKFHETKHFLEPIKREGTHNDSHK